MRCGGRGLCWLPSLRVGCKYPPWLGSELYVSEESWLSRRKQAAGVPPFSSLFTGDMPLLVALSYCLDFPSVIDCKPRVRRHIYPFFWWLAFGCSITMTGIKLEQGRTFYKTYFYLPHYELMLLGCFLETLQYFWILKAITNFSVWSKSPRKIREELLRK